MILNSADILRILGGNEVVRLSAKIKIVESKPVVSGQEGLFIYIKRYPDLDEFEAVFTLWIESDGSEPDDIVIAEIKTLLPRVEVQSGLMATITTTEFRTEKTQAAPQKVEAPKADLSGLEARFEALAEDIQDRMLLVSSGKPGKDGKKGKDGKDGRDGRDGKDLVATDASLNDLKDVDIENRIALEKGHVLTWDGLSWTNLFIPQLLSSGGGGSETVSTGLPSTTIEFKYHNETGEPHDREFHTNSADPTQVTILHVAHTNNSGTDISSLLAGLVPNTDRIYVYKVNEPSSAHLYSLSSYVETANGFELTVAHLETPGGEPAFVNNSIYGFTFITAGTGGGGGITDAPSDNTPYVRYNGTWITWAEARDITAQLADIVDGGDFDQDLSFTGTTTTFDGGDFQAGTTAASDQEVLDGGDFVPEDDLVLDGGLATV